MTRTILLVEDDAVFREKVLRPQLERRGFTVLEAAKVREAEQLLAQRSVDLLIVDGLLPDKTGVDLIRGLRERGDQTPVVFLSAFWKDNSAYRTLHDLGVTEILHKPVGAEELCARIDRLLGPLPGGTT